MTTTPAQQRRDISLLSEKETTIVALLAEGLRDWEIAERVHLSRGTVSRHVDMAKAKLGLVRASRVTVALYWLTATGKLKGAE